MVMNCRIVRTFRATNLRQPHRLAKGYFAHGACRCIGLAQLNAASTPCEPGARPVQTESTICAIQVWAVLVQSGCERTGVGVRARRCRARATWPLGMCALRSGPFQRKPDVCDPGSGSVQTWVWNVSIKVLVCGVCERGSGGVRAGTRVVTAGLWAVSIEVWVCARRSLGACEMGSGCVRDGLWTVPNPKISRFYAYCPSER